MLKDKILEALKSEYKDLGLDVAAFDRVADFLEISITEESQIESIVKNEKTKAMLKGIESDIGKRVSKFKKDAEKLELEIAELKKKKPGAKTVEELGAEIAELKKVDPTNTTITELEAEIAKLKKGKEPLTAEEIEALIAKGGGSSKEAAELKKRLDDIENASKIKEMRKNVWDKFKADDITNATLEETYRKVIFDKMSDDFESEDLMYEELKKRCDELDVSVAGGGFTPAKSKFAKKQTAKELADFGEEMNQKYNSYN